MKGSKWSELVVPWVNNEAWVEPDMMTPAHSLIQLRPNQMVVINKCKVNYGIGQITQSNDFTEFKTRNLHWTFHSHSDLVKSPQKLLQLLFQVVSS
jgi:hypothetical protein